MSEDAICDEPTNLVHRVNVAHARLLLGDLERAGRAYVEIAGHRDPETGAATALGDLDHMRSAAIEPPGGTCDRTLRQEDRV